MLAGTSASKAALSSAAVVSGCWVGSADGCIINLLLIVSWGGLRISVQLRGRVLVFFFFFDG